MIKNYPPIRSLWTLLLVVLTGFLANAASPVEMSSFTSTSANMDDVISYTTAKGDGTSNPAIIDGEIRLYQNGNGIGGGTITIHAADGYLLTNVTIGSSMKTSIAHTIGESTVKSSTESLAANGRHTVNDINSNSITFYCMGKDSNSRLYVNYLSVTYQSASTDPAISFDPNTLTELNFSAYKGTSSKTAVKLTLENMSGTLTLYPQLVAGTGNYDSVEGGFASVFSVQAVGGSSTDYNVTFNAPATEGEYRATLTFVASVNESQVFSPTITLIGVSTGPTISASPAALDFSALTGATDEKTVTLTLDHVAADDISPAITGDNYFQAQRTSKTDLVEYKVTFTAPNQPGSYKATLTFSADAATSAVVELSGTAVAPPLDAPVATDASNISNTSFTANWNEVQGATSYKVDVYKKSDVVTKTNDYDNKTYEFENNKHGTGTYNGTTIKMDDTGDYVETQVFDAAITSVGFTIKNNGVSSTGSKLKLYGKNAQTLDYVLIKTWTVTDIASQNKVGSVEELIEGGYTQLKLEYTKSGGNVGLNKLSVTYGGTEYVERDKSVAALSYSVENLQLGTKYFYVVRAADDSRVSENSNEMAVTTFDVVTVSTFPANEDIGVKVLQTSRMSITFNKSIASVDASKIRISYEKQAAETPAPAAKPRLRAAETVTLGVVVLENSDPNDDKTVTFRADTWDTCLPAYATIYTVDFVPSAVTFTDGQTSPATSWIFLTEDVGSGIHGVEAAKALLYDGHSVIASDGGIVELYNLAGARIASARGSLNLDNLAHGVYVARCGSMALKVVKR